MTHRKNKRGCKGRPPLHIRLAQSAKDKARSQALKNTDQKEKLIDPPKPLTKGPGLLSKIFKGAI